jgi:LytS/YehU family sensor histidine kinase
LPFNIILTTAIGFIVTVLFGTWQDLGANLITSYCIGFIILLLNLVLRVFVLRRSLINPPLLALVYFATVPLGFVLGMPVGDWLTGQEAGNATIGAMFSLIGGSFAMLYVISVERQRRAERAEKAAVSAQLRLLQAQIEPHFLFNTLANLDALMASEMPAARTLLAHLNRYLRASLEYARSGSTTLETEVALLQAYLAIMEMRLPNRLRFRVQCGADCATVRFPPMLIQPLVENAVTHGIEPAPQGGEITVAIHRAAERLVVTVSDTGAGWGRSRTHGTGTGLANVRERLQAQYGDAASLTTCALEPHGARVEISIPVRLLEANES